MCHISPSRLLQSHVSPILAVPWRSLRDHSWLWRPNVLAVLTCLESAGHAHFRTSSEKFGYLAKSALDTGYEPKKFVKITSVDSDTVLIDDPDVNQISDFSKNTRENTGLFGVLTMFESSVSHVSQNYFCIQVESKESMHRETDCWTERERERKEGKRRFCDQCCKPMTKKNRRNNIRGHSLQTLRKFYSDGRDLREHLERRAQQAVIGENSIQRKLYLNEYKMEIQNLKRRNSEHALFDSQRELESQRRQLEKAHQWADQAQRERIHLCSRLRWRTIFRKKAMQEVAEKLKIFFFLKNVAIKRKTLKTMKIGTFSYAAWSGITNSESILLRSWLTEQLWRTYVPHQALITSSSRKPSREVGMPRNTRDNMSRKRFWSSTCPTRSWRITQWFKKFGDSENRRNWEQWQRRTIAINSLPCFSVRARREKI